MTTPSSPSQTDWTHRIDEFVRGVLGFLGRYVRTGGVVLVKPAAATRILREPGKYLSWISFLFISGVLLSFSGLYFFKYLTVIGRMRDLTDLSVALHVVLSRRPAMLLAMGAALGLVGLVYVIGSAIGGLVFVNADDRREMAGAVGYAFGAQMIVGVIFFVLVAAAGQPGVSYRLTDVVLRGTALYGIVLGPVIALAALRRMGAFRKSRSKAGKSFTVTIGCVAGAVLCAVVFWFADGVVAEKLYPMQSPVRLRALKEPTLKYDSDQISMTVVIFNVDAGTILLQEAPVLMLSGGGKSAEVTMQFLDGHSETPLKLAGESSVAYQLRGTLPGQLKGVASIEESCEWVIFDPSSGITEAVSCDRLPVLAYSISGK